MCEVNIMSRKYIIVNKKRFFTFITLLVFILIGLVTLLVSSQVSHSQEEIHYNEYRVGQGDTLWKISEHYLDQDIDIRQFIHKIRQLNDMKTSAIYEGDIIKYL